MNANSTVSVSRNFTVSAERVFDAWLDESIAKKWLFATPLGKMIRAEVDPRVGGAFVFVDRRGEIDVEHVGTYLEIDRPRRLVFTFSVPQFSKLSTEVAIDISSTASGCALTLTQSGVLSEYVERTEKGWSMLLDSLAHVLVANDANA